jgi:chain length determinant protein EpsF
MSLAQFLAILRARWITALLVLALAVGVAGAVVSLMPRSYTATATVLVDVKTPDPIAGGVLPGLMSPTYMATQADVIQSARVARRVVRSLKLADNPAMRTQWREATKGAGDYETWVGELLERSLEVKPSRESNVISIGYKSVDPKFAAALANAYAQAYVDATLELRVEPARLYTGFFEDRAKQLRENVERAQDRLSAFQREKGIIAVDERLDVETARLNELSSQLVAMQTASADSRSREAQARTGADTLQEIINNPVVAGLRSDLTRQEARLQELSARFGDAHPQVIELRASIAELRSRLQAETSRVGTSVGVSTAVNQSREAQVRSALEAQRAKVLQLKGLRDDVNVLVRDVDAAQRAYDAVQARGSQSSLESQSTQTNILVLSPATEPVVPSSPKVLLTLLAATFVGTMLGIAAAMMRELLDRRVRSGDDLTAALQVPILGVLPRGGMRPARRRRGWSWRRRGSASQNWEDLAQSAPGAA